jgi:hypothetical protein
MPISHPNKRVQISTSYVADGTESQIVTTAAVPLGASATITLPVANTVGPTDGLLINDEGGLLTIALTLTIVVADSSPISGAASVVLSAAFGKVNLYSNGMNWFVR